MFVASGADAATGLGCDCSSSTQKSSNICKGFHSLVDNTLDSMCYTP